MSSPDWILELEHVRGLAQVRSPAAIDELLAITTNGPSDGARGRALAALASVDLELAWPHLRAAAASSNALLRAIAYDGFGMTNSAAARSSLESGLADVDRAARWHAIAALAAMDGSNLWSVVEAADPLSATNAEAQCVLALHAVGTDEARNVIRKLMQHEDAGRRLRYVRALHAVRDAGLVSNLVATAVGDRGPPVRDAAISVLRSCDADFLGPPLAAVLRAGDPRWRSQVVSLLFERPSRIGGDAVAELLAPSDEPLPRALMLQCIDTLLTLDPLRYQDLLGRYAEDKDPAVRQRAVRALATGRSEEEMFKLLQKPLTDPDRGNFNQALELFDAYTSGTPPEGFAVYFATFLETIGRKRIHPLLKLIGSRLGAEDVPAVRMLFADYLGSPDAELRRKTADIFVLVADEEDMEKVIQDQGYVTQWMILGPFDNDRYNRGYHQAHPPEREIDLAKRYPGAVRRGDMFSGIDPTVFGEDEGDSLLLKWSPHKVLNVDGRVNLGWMTIGPADYLLGYALARLVVEQATNVNVELDVDDSYKCWLNGALISEGGNEAIAMETFRDRDKWRELAKRWQDNTQSLVVSNVTLQAGTNDLMLKACNYTDHWYFRTRITDAAGQKADLVQAEFVQDAGVVDEREFGD